MLITRFHQMIRHRVVWAVIATIVSVAFLLSFTTMRGCMASKKAANSVGKLYDADVTPAEFQQAMYFETNFGKDRNPSPEAYAQERKQAWRRLAILRTAARMGITVPDEEIGQMLGHEKSFLSNGVFDKDRYRSFVYQRGVDIPTFEEYLRQNLTMQKVMGVLEATVWTAPTDLERRLRNLTDTRDVEYVRLRMNQYTGKVTVTAADARAFYEGHRETFRIPERVSVCYVTFPYSNYIPANVADADVRDYYDAHSEDFTPSSTNAYALTEPLEKVRTNIETRLRADGARFKAREDATTFVMDLAPDRAGHHPAFETLAAAHHLGVATTALFAADEKLPDLQVDQEFNRAAFGLVPADPELCFSDSIQGSNAVYVLMAHEHHDAYVPDFEAIHDAVMPLAVSNQTEQAFLKWAESTRDSLAASVASNRSFRAAAKDLGFNVSTTGTFTVLEGLSTNLFAYSDIIVPAVVELDQGEVGKLATAEDLAFVVYVVSRAPGKSADVYALRPQMLRQLQDYQGGLAFADWGNQILKDANFQDFAAPHTNAVPDDADTPSGS